MLFSLLLLLGQYCLLAQTGTASAEPVHAPSFAENQWHTLQELSAPHEQHPNAVQHEASDRSAEPATPRAAEPDLAPAAPQLHVCNSETDQRRSKAPMLPPIPEDHEAELPPEEKHCQAPSLGQAEPPASHSEGHFAPQEPAQAQAQVGVSPTRDPSPNSDSPPGFLIQSPAVHASLAACMEATPAQQQQRPPAMTAQHPVSPDATTPAEAVVVADDHLTEAAIDWPDDACRAEQQGREPPNMPPAAGESSAMAFSPGVNGLVTGQDSGCLTTCSQNSEACL